MKTLQDIKGIGPKVEELLVNNGIPDLASLSKKTVQEVQEILTKAGGIMAQKDPSDWIEQANAALAEETPNEQPSGANTTSVEPTEEEMLQQRIERHNSLKEDAANAEAEAAEAKTILGTKKMRAVQTVGGNVLYIERNFQNVNNMVRAVDAQRAPGVKGDVTGIVIYQDASTLDGGLPVPPEELAEVLATYIQEKIGSRGVVVATSLKAAKAAGQNPGEVEVSIKGLLRNATGVVRSKADAINKEYQVQSASNYDAYLPVLE